jgi:hypothetical protein
LPGMPSLREPKPSPNTSSNDLKIFHSCIFYTLQLNIIDKT